MPAMSLAPTVDVRPELGYVGQVATARKTTWTPATIPTRKKTQLARHNPRPRIDLLLPPDVQTTPLHNYP
jgi:hypothetical protein